MIGKHQINVTHEMIQYIQMDRHMFKAMTI